MIAKLSGLLAIMFLATNTVCLAKDKQNVSLTIYSKAVPGSIAPETYRPVPGTTPIYNNGNSVPGYAMVKDRRVVDLKDKLTNIDFNDVAAYIDPTTVIFKSLSNPNDTSVLEQKYLFDLVSKEKLLQKYLDQEIAVTYAKGDAAEEVRGKLLSTDGGLTLVKNNGEVVSLNNYISAGFPELKEGLMTKPTLSWKILTKSPGTQNIEVSYQTSGITWWADYNAVFTPAADANKGTLDLNAWVSILNRSGTSYLDSGLKLIAGDVQRAEPQMAPQYMKRGLEMAVSDEVAGGFAEKAFFEYHMYSLPRKVTIADNSTMQIELFDSVKNIPVTKEFVYNGAIQPDKIGVYLKIMNDQKNGLGIPLPAGRIRINQQDSADGSLEFIGEDVINHTPKDEELSLKLGNAFDVTGKREQVNFRQDDANKLREEEYEITLKNHKDTKIDLKVEEQLGGYQNWKIIYKTENYIKKNSSTIIFPVSLAKDEEKKIRYKVRYSW